MPLYLPVATPYVVIIVRWMVCLGDFLWIVEYGSEKSVVLIVQTWFLSEKYSVGVLFEA